jgi:hypothetical protein
MVVMAITIMVVVIMMVMGIFLTTQRNGGGGDGDEGTRKWRKMLYAFDIYLVNNIKKNYKCFSYNQNSLKIHLFNL